MIRAVLWDFGGVLTSSPFEAFRDFERRNGYPEDFIRRVNSTNPDDNAWARLERSEITVEQFDSLFDAEARAAGQSLPGRRVLELLAGELRPAMVRALRCCARQFKTACLTNNVAQVDGPSMARSEASARDLAEIFSIFDVVLESSKTGLRKPDPRFYQAALDALSVTASECVYLDDLGINLKPARQMGMTTIKVTDPDKAIANLEEVIGIPLYMPNRLVSR